MHMSEQEIKDRFKRMDPDCHRIQILADLNECCMDEIVQIVKDSPRRTRVDKHRISILYDLGWTDNAIATTLQISKDSVLGWRHNQDPPKEPNRKAPQLDAERVRRLYEEGLDDQEIGRLCEVPGANIRRWRRCNDLPTKHHRGGDQSGHRKSPSGDYRADPCDGSWIPPRGMDSID